MAPSPFADRLVSEPAFPLSYGQKSLWYMHWMLPSSSAYNVGFAVRIHSGLSAQVLRQALQALLDRHASLRSLFRVGVSGELEQWLPPFQPLAFEEVTATGWTHAELRSRVDLDYHRPFDLAAGPLFRAHLYFHPHLFSEAGDQAFTLLLNFHHIVFDGPSMFMLVGELATIYSSLLAGEPPDLRPPKNSFRDFVEWQTSYLNGPEGSADLAWWKRRLQAAPQFLSLPTDHARPAHLTGRGGSNVIQLDRALVDGLRVLALRCRARFYDVLLATYQLLLYRYSGQQDLLVGFLTSGRTQLKFARTCGFFINPIVLRACPTPELSFVGFLARVTATLAEGLEHQDYPFLALVEHSQVVRLPGCMPLVQALFNFFKAPRNTCFEELFVPEGCGLPVTAGALTMESFGLRQDDGEFDLMLEVADGNRCWLRFRYSAELFTHDTIHRLTGHYVNLLRSILAAPEQSLDALPMLDAAERAEVLSAVACPRRAYAENCGIHQLFEAQAARTPDRVAVTCGARSMTYGELDHESNLLAAHLLSLPLPPGSLVGICLRRSCSMLVAMLAVLKAGAAYVPLDPAFPAARLRLIVADSQPALLLTESSLVKQFPADSPVILQMDTDAAAWRGGPGLSPGLACPGDSLAYVIYTSGSTGRPKGVAIPHRAFTNFQLSMLERPGLSADDVLLAVTTISFDIAGLELFAPLILGGRVIIATGDMVLDGRRLAACLREHPVTVMQATPATWRLLLESGWTGSPALKALCGGEAMSPALATRLLPLVASLWNMYGPTETTVWSAVHHVREVRESIPLGSPVANTSLVILDRNLQPVPFGVPGELCIGGAGVARGYWNRPDLTALAFLPDPFSPSGMLYRTGDLCRLNAAREIVFLGRLDDQVKVRGHRIEPGDIEVALLRLPQLRQAAVVVQEDPALGARLVAFMVEAAGAGRLTASDLRRSLATDLPDYMVPSAFVYLDALPLTPNNKIDRKVLRTLRAQAEVAAREFRAPRTPTEVAVASLWAEMLRVGRIGLDDRFDELGGDSLTFALMIVRLGRQLQVELPIVLDETTMTVSGLADVVERVVPQAGPAPSLTLSAPRETTPPFSWLGAFLVRLTMLLVRAATNIHCEGLESVPACGPLVFTGNHMSLFDFLIVGSALRNRAGGWPVRPAFIIADRWKNCIHAYASQLGNPIYIRRGKGDLDALGGALSVLAAKGVVAIMPEGRPSRQGLLRARTGAAWLVDQSGAAVLPFAVYGHELAFRYWLRLRRVPVKIRIGPPFQMDKAYGHPGHDLQARADHIMSAIAALMPPSYHGYYRGKSSAEQDKR